MRPAAPRSAGGPVGDRAGRSAAAVLPPPYCPEPNPTEYPNHAVKGTVPRVKRARSPGELADQVRTYLRVVQQWPRLARRFSHAEPVSYAA